MSNCIITYDEAKFYSGRCYEDFMEAMKEADLELCRNNIVSRYTARRVKTSHEGLAAWEATMIGLASR